MLDWLTAYKIPVGDSAEAVFDWIRQNLGFMLDALSWAMENLIDGILWVLETPHPFIIIAAFVAITWALQRNWKTCAFVALGFLFVLNQDYWE